MANFYAFYPPGGAASSNASVGTNGVTAPTSSTEVGGVGPDGNLHPISTDNTGNQNVNVVSSTLPTGGATSANQVTMEATLTAIQGNQTNGNQQTQIVGTVPLPTGASTSANQTTANNSLATIATNTTGASTAANQATANSSLATIATNSNTQATSANQTNGNQITQVSNFPATLTPATVFYTGQQTSTGTAVAISASHALLNGAILQAKSTNTSSIYVGPAGVTTATGMELQPGQATSAAINNLSAIYVISVTSGDGLCYIGS